MKRRNYLAAIATIMGVSGCIESTEKSMSQEEAKQTFSDITEFEPPMDSVDEAARFVDEEAGVVFWTFIEGGTGDQLEVVTKDLSETVLK